MANVFVTKYAMDNKERHWKLHSVYYPTENFHELWSTNG